MKCISCGYLLWGINGSCPECGQKINPTDFIFDNWAIVWQCPNCKQKTPLLGTMESDLSNHQYTCPSCLTHHQQDAIRYYPAPKGSTPHPVRQGSRYLILMLTMAGVNLALFSTLIMTHIARINPPEHGIPFSQQSIHARVGILLTTPTAILHPNSDPWLFERVLAAILYVTFGALLSFYLGRHLSRKIALTARRSSTAPNFVALTLRTKTYFATVILALVFICFSLVLGIIPSPASYQTPQLTPLKLTIFYAAMPTAMRHRSLEFQPIDILLGLTLYATLCALLSFCIRHLLTRRRLRRHQTPPPAS
jgi:predicted RNA-binding Zn-ribbon protein involved in translation (DUF1610 family)